ncbi:MAG: hypothetical protein K6B75_08020 [Lachnospiraceae bacterium]|nr:hypothetical protein [Lachnospiraceae bacterium]
MQVSKHFIVEAVGLLITVALLSIALGMYKNTEDGLRSIKHRQEATLKRLEEYEITKYDGCLVKGSMAASFVRMAVCDYGLHANISTGKTNYTICEAEMCYLMNNISADEYVNPLNSYKCRVYRDVNGALSEISIELY